MSVSIRRELAAVLATILARTVSPVAMSAPLINNGNMNTTFGDGPDKLDLKNNGTISIYGNDMQTGEFFMQYWFPGHAAGTGMRSGICPTLQLARSGFPETWRPNNTLQGLQDATHALCYDSHQSITVA